MAKLRLGLEDHRIARPLTWALLRGDYSETFDARLLPHARIATLLREGALDVGLLNAGDIDEGLRAVPDLGVVLAAGGGAATLESVDDDSTRDERVLCPGIRARFEQWRAETGASGCRLIARLDGEPAPSCVEVNGTIDFAQAYRQQFGAEPVIYLWATRVGFDPSEAEFALKSSLRSGLAALSAISREVASDRRLALDSQSVYALYTEGVRYVRTT